jgi:hemoglobin-like flavoprotein
LPTESVIEAVRASCARIPVGSTRLAERFYENLFAMAPEVRAMFPDDLRPQHKRMASALLEVVQHLDSPDDVARYLQDLGAQHHRDLEVEPEHYPFVGRALVRAVSEISPTWSSSMSSAWVLVYEWITANMLAGAERAAEQAAGAHRAPGDRPSPRHGRPVPEHQAPAPEHRQAPPERQAAPPAYGSAAPPYPAAAPGHTPSDTPSVPADRAVPQYSYDVPGHYRTSRSSP